MTTSSGKVYKNILWFVLIHSVYKAWTLQDWGKILRLVIEKIVSLVCCFNVSVINCHAEHFSVRCNSPLVMSTGFDTSPLLSHMGCIPHFISHWVFIFSIRGGWFIVLVFVCFCFFVLYFLPLYWWSSMCSERIPCWTVTGQIHQLAAELNAQL